MAIRTRSEHPYGMGRLFWAPRELVDMADMAEKLTCQVSHFDGTVEDLRLWEVNDDFVGVPREWGLKNIITPWDKVDDTCTFPLRTWPGMEGKYRPGQAEAVRALVNYFQKKGYGCRLEAPCGSGKTLVALAVAAGLGTRAVVLVHKEDLMEQWVGTANDFFPGAKVGIVQGDLWDWEDKDVVIAMTQTLYSRRDFVNKSGFDTMFGLQICDEGHRYPARTFEQVLRMFFARYRLAVSATWKRGDGMDEVWDWHIGPVGHVMCVDRMVGEWVRVPWKTKLEDAWFIEGGEVARSTYINSIAAQPGFTTWLAGQAAKGAAAGRTVLVVSDRIKQLHAIDNELAKMGSRWATGVYCRSWPKPDNPKERRTVSKKELEGAKTAPIILATYGMMSEGTDIPALDTLILATPRADVEQVVGRIQRPDGAKRPLLIVDPVFVTPYNEALFGKRAAIYDKLGFSERKKK